MTTALPRSTFVMGAVTLALFGVAIYETVTDKPARVRGAYNLDDNVYEDEDDEAESDDRLAEFGRQQGKVAYEREQQRIEQKAADAEALAANRAELKKLFDAEVALPGELFHGVKLDDPQPVPLDVVDAFTAFMNSTGSNVYPETWNDRVARFEIVPGAAADSDVRRTLCNELHAMLVTTWGAGRNAGDWTEMWTNKVAGIRAGFQDRPVCKLVFERFDEPQAWINTSKTSTVPLWLLGKPAKVLDELPGATKDGPATVWNARGLGVGPVSTRLAAWVKNGKVSYITAQTVVTASTEAELKDHLRSSLGEPQVVDAGGGAIRLKWPARHLDVLVGDGAIIAMIGTSP